MPYKHEFLHPLRRDRHQDELPLRGFTSRTLASVGAQADPGVLIRRMIALTKGGTGGTLDRGQTPVARSGTR